MQWALKERMPDFIVYLMKEAVPFHDSKEEKEIAEEEEIAMAVIHIRDYWFALQKQMKNREFGECEFGDLFGKAVYLISKGNAGYLPLCYSLLHSFIACLLMKDYSNSKIRVPFIPPSEKLPETLPNETIWNLISRRFCCMPSGFDMVSHVRKSLQTACLSFDKKRVVEVIFARLAELLKCLKVRRSSGEISTVEEYVNLLENELRKTENEQGMRLDNDLDTLGNEFDAIDDRRWSCNLPQPPFEIIDPKKFIMANIKGAIRFGNIKNAYDNGETRECISQLWQCISNFSGTFKINDKDEEFDNLTQETSKKYHAIHSLQMRRKALLLDLYRRRLALNELRHAFTPVGLSRQIRQWIETFEVDRH
jgi:hypothetical protein